MQTNFRRNLSIGFGLSLLVLVISTVASFVSIRKLLESSKLANRNLAVITELESLSSTVKDAETSQRGYLLTGEPEFLEPYQGTYQRAMNSISTLRQLTAADGQQQQRCDRLKELILKRLSLLETLINLKKANKSISLADLRKGKSYMDGVRQSIKEIDDHVRQSPIRRTENLSRFASLGPLLIIASAIMAMIISGIFYMRVKKDFAEKTVLQNELETKDRNINRRIQIIQEVADKISAGNYKIRVGNEEKDTLGSVADSLNKMTESLEYSFDLLSYKEWLQRGVAGLSEKMIGETDINRLTANVISFVAGYTNSQVGTLYMNENDHVLRLCNGFAFIDDGTRTEIKMGEGLVGQCALTGQRMMLNDINADQIFIHFAAGGMKPKNVIAIPLLNEGIVKGVIELATIDEYSQKDLAFLDVISEPIGIVLKSIQNSVRMQELLEETQSQTKALHAQHTELQDLNYELESHAQKLQASEEELRVQQEELLEANQELEERTSLLEERNQLIQERNIEIQTKAEQLEVSTKYKSEFLANMSHELRTPLNSILLLSGMMAVNNEDKLAEEYVEYAKVIQNSGNGLLELIDAILDLSKIESGKMELSFESVSVEEIVSDLRGLFMPVARQKNIEFVINIDREVPANIITDRMRLGQVIKNLLANALKFTPGNGTVTLEIFKPSGEKGFIAFVVKDTGIGIAPEKQQLIFEAFQQADGSTHRKYGGTGLGLSISRELVRLLNGKIHLVSELGKGSEFSVYIPLIKPVSGNGNAEFIQGVNSTQPLWQNYINDTAEISEEYAVNMSWRSGDDRQDFSREDKFILIIEDDIDFAKVLLNFTRKNGYKGIMCTSGQEGLELARKYQPFGILLDIKQPVKKGWEIIEELKKDPRTRHIPVHIMSWNELARESLEKGAADFINKQVVFEKIMDIFKKIDNAPVQLEKKVLIVEENEKHAQALAFFLESFEISTKIEHNTREVIDTLLQETVKCVIMDMSATEPLAYEILEEVRQTAGLENLSIIVLTAKNLTKKEEFQLKKIADSIVVKTAFSYQRILDEISLFLHVVQKEKPLSKNHGQFISAMILNEELTNKTVLIADDDVRNIFSLTKALETFKMNIISALDGKDALYQLQENPQVDIVLMDMMMPEMDGYEAIIQIRKDPRLRDMPVIAVTAKAMAGDREKCIEAGASDYITKPVDIDQLLSLLRVWLYEKQFT